MKDILDKAVKGGYWFSDIPKDAKWDVDMYGRIGIVQLQWSISDTEFGMRSIAFNDIIFQIPFLKAFFPETDRYECGIICVGNTPDSCFEEVGEVWQYHAQQLVLSTDRKSYLKRFI